MFWRKSSRQGASGPRPPAQRGKESIDESAGPSDTDAASSSSAKPHFLTGDKLADQRIVQVLLDAIRRVSEFDVSQLRDLDKLLQDIVDTAVEVTGAERGLLLTTNASELQVRVARSQGSPIEEEIRFSTSVVRRVVSSQEPCRATVQSDADALVLGQSVFDLKLRAVMCVPLSTRRTTTTSSVVGALYVDARAATREFSQSDLELFAALAQHMSVAMENVRLYMAMVEVAKAASHVPDPLEIVGSTRVFIQPPLRSVEAEKQAGRREGPSARDEQAHLAGAGMPDVPGFQLRRKIAEGGQSTVYLAQDSDSKVVAIKLFNADSGVSSVTIEQWLREREIAGRLNDPGICPLLDGGVTEGGLAFAVMPFVKGESLSRRIRRARRLRDDYAEESIGMTALQDSDDIWLLPRPVPVEEPPKICDHLRPALQLFEALALTLEHAHQAGVVHCDIKPGNIMVSLVERPVLLDFGLARLAYSSIGGRVQGTPLYMAPEQTESGSTADPRSDVFALGVVLFETLSLQHPFADDYILPERLFHRVRHDPPRRIYDYNPFVPAPIRELVERCLEKSPSDRFESAGAVAEALAAILHG